MSRNKPTAIPEGMTVTTVGNTILVRKGTAELILTLPQSGDAAVDKGTQSSLIANAIAGLTSGFSKTLEIQGTGYKVLPKDKGLEFFLGYSHTIYFEPPQGITLAVKDNRLITVTGADKYLVGQVSANLRNLRRPDVYKGKGIRYLGEVIKLKPGKAAKAAGEG